MEILKDLNSIFKVTISYIFCFILNSPLYVYISNVYTFLLPQVSDDQIIMMNNSKSFELCQKDYESEYFKDILYKHTPPTKWCYNASLGLSTYDNYAIYIQFKNVRFSCMLYHPKNKM